MSDNLKGVKFGDIHTSTFGVYLSKITIGTPSPKKFMVDIPGADGSLDMTDYFGGVKYDNRKLTFIFTFPQRGKQLLNVYSDFLNAVHGKHFDSIILDDDNQFHYAGRVTVGNLAKAALSKVTVECECEPYKYSNTRKVITLNVDSVEFPENWLYGDVNGDGVIDQSDSEMIESLIGKRSFESDNALRADFDFDGKVTEDEKTVLDYYLKYGDGQTFQEYVTAEPVSFYFRNCRRKIIDFGGSPVKVNFEVESINSSKLWDLKIDNIPQFILTSRKSYSMILSGVHEIMITVPIYTSGVFKISWDNQGSL